MKIKKIVLSLLCLFTIFTTSGLFGLNYDNTDPVLAALDEKLTQIGPTPKFYWENGSVNKCTMPMNIYTDNDNGNYFRYNMQTLGFDYDEFVDADQFTAYRDVIYEGEEVFGDYISNLWIENNSGQLGYVDPSFSITQSNANIYIESDEFADLSLSFSNELLGNLSTMASTIDYDFMMPLFWLDNTPAIYIKARKNNPWPILYSNNDIIEAAISYSNGEESPSTGELNIYACPEICVLFRIKPSTITRISSITSLTWNHAALHGGTNYKITNNNRYEITKYLISPYCESQQLHIRAVHNVKVLPAEIKYFDVETGSLTLGHSLTHERYGIADHTWFLNSITFGIYQNGNIRDYTYTLNTKTQYENLLNTDVVTPYTFYYGPRVPYDKESGEGYVRKETNGNISYESSSAVGSGGLVYGYQMQAGEIVNPSHSSVIDIKSLTFYKTTDENNRFEFFSEITNPETKTVYLNNKEVTFNWYADKCTALIHVDMYERNESNLHETSYTGTPSTYITAELLLPGFGAIGTWLAGVIASNVSSSGKNIQRFYFNFFEKLGLEQIPIDKVMKLQFKYQLGNYPRETIQYNWIDDRDHSKGYRSVTLHQVDGVPVEHETVAVRNSHKETTVHTINEQMNSLGYIEQNEVDGFVDARSDNIVINDVKYSYFYQHVYHTDDFHDWMCYFSPLSIWYETTTGTTIRGTTDIDGYYLTYDPDGNEIVMNIEDPENPSDMTVDEFLDREAEDVTVVEYEDPEENTTDQIVTNISNWWNSVVDWFKNTGGAMGTFLKVLAIVAIVIIVLIVVVLLIKFIRWIYRSIKDDGSGSGHRRN